MNRADAIIVGGGIAGLTAARVMLRGGFRPVVLDKGRGPGGRLATLRLEMEAGEAVFDYGAQQVSARSPHFQKQMDQWIEAGVTSEWCRGLPAPGKAEPDDRTVRYRGTKGLRGLAVDLARDVELHQQTRVTSVSRSRDGWSADTADGRRLEGRALLITTPVPQALDLLEASGVSLSPAHGSMLSSITYDPCIAVLALTERRAGLPDPGALRLAGEPLVWAADNHRKGISPLAGAVTLHAGPRTSERLWTAGDDETAGELLAAAEPWIGSSPRLVTVHRWRYSRPVSKAGIPFAGLGTSPPMALAGDGFGDSRVEGAWNSGRLAGGWLRAQLGRPDAQRPNLTSSFPEDGR